MESLLLFKKAMAALITVPVIACLVIGKGGQLGKFMSSGISSVAATGAMFIFAVLFFTIMDEKVNIKE